MGKLAAIFPTMYLSGGTCVLLIINGGGSLQLFYKTIINDDDHKGLTGAEWFLVFVCIAILVALFFPNLNSLASISVVGSLTGVAYCTILWTLSVSKGRPQGLGVTYDDPPEASTSKVDSFLDIANALALISLAFRGHNIILEIQGGHDGHFNYYLLNYVLGIPFFSRFFPFCDWVSPDFGACRSPSHDYTSPSSASSPVAAAPRRQTQPPVALLLAAAARREGKTHHPEPSPPSTASRRRSPLQSVAACRSPLVATAARCPRLALATARPRCLSPICSSSPYSSGIIYSIAFSPSKNGLLATGDIAYKSKSSIASPHVERSVGILSTHSIMSFSASYCRVLDLW
nr:lysine histidine transporter-like 8 [Ipomoea trifida]